MTRKPKKLVGFASSSGASGAVWAVFFFCSSLSIGLLGIAHQAEARITGIVIQTRTSPAFGGTSFGVVGQYEQLTGVAFGEVDPKDPLNAVITDIELAPRNSRGNVEYSMDFSITKPLDMSRSNKTLLYDVPNRGNIRSPELNIGGNATNVGDGFLQREGYTLVDSGWEGDLTTGLRITLPVAKRRDGREIRGRVRAEYILGSPASTQDVTEPPAYEANQHRQLQSNADAARPSERPARAYPEQPVGFCRLHCGAVPWRTGPNQGLPPRGF